MCKCVKNVSECVKNVVSWVSQVGDKVGKGTSALIDALPSLKEDHHVVMVRYFFLFTLQKNISRLFTIYLPATQRARKFKKVQTKKLVKANKSNIFFRDIAILAVLNFFPSSKICFWPFLKLQKM